MGDYIIKINGMYRGTSDLAVVADTLSISEHRVIANKSQEYGIFWTNESGIAYDNLAFAVSHLDAPLLIYSVKRIPKPKNRNKRL
jgi:hypothetical protein